TIIAYLAEESAPKVFMLWGSHAQSKRQLIPASSKHLVLMANHPSPLSAQRPPVPFLGCRHFAIANDWLAQMQRPPIDWIGDPVPVSCWSCSFRRHSFGHSAMFSLAPHLDRTSREHACRVAEHVRTHIEAAGGSLPFDAYMHEVL